jgi:hypothetical protein
MGRVTLENAYFNALWLNSGSAVDNAAAGKKPSIKVVNCACVGNAANIITGDGTEFIEIIGGEVTGATNTGVIGVKIAKGVEIHNNGNHGIDNPSIVDGCWIHDNWNAGVISDSAGVRVVNSRINNNNRSAGASGGIQSALTGNSDNIVISNNTIIETTPIRQRNSGDANWLISNNSITGTSTFAGTYRAINNIGLANNMMRQATIASGQSTVIVTHGLGYTPTRVLLTPRANVGQPWTTAIGATTFTINVASAVGATTLVDWLAE